MTRCAECETPRWRSRYKWRGPLVLETLGAPYSAFVWLLRPSYATCEGRRKKINGNSANRGDWS